MIDAQTVDFSFSYKSQHETVSGFKYGIILHADSRQIIGIKKTAVVDVVGCNSPVRQPERLRLNEFMEFVEACRIRRSPVDLIYGLVDGGNDFRRSCAQLRQSAFVNFLI